MRFPSVTTVLGPDFFIVGAPKSGTTSLHAYLSAHPAIFMARKEQHFFGSDLADVYAQPSADTYFASFSGGRSATMRGDASVWYLRSRRAAQEIHAYNPRARIIAILRNPVDLLHSYHIQCLWGGWEDIRDFKAALAAEAERRNGRRIPPMNRSNPWRLLYRDVVRFADPIERYLSLFGRERVKVLLFDDLIERPAQTYSTVLGFLGVDTTFRPQFSVVNPNKYNRSHTVRRVVNALQYPSARVRRVGRRLVPVRAVRRAVLNEVVPMVTRWNMRVTPRPPIDPELRSRLTAEFAPDVARLSALLGRDLSHWLTPKTDLAAAPPGVYSVS